jgi:hypothetical protein
VESTVTRNQQTTRRVAEGRRAWIRVSATTTDDDRRCLEGAAMVSGGCEAFLLALLASFAEERASSYRLDVGSLRRIRLS